MSLLEIIIYFFVSFFFRYFRELEDEIARQKMFNRSLLPLRFGEHADSGSFAKWAFPLTPYQKRWYHFGIHPRHKERFPFSSTIFVFVTDQEHFYQFIQTVCIITLIALKADLFAVLLGFAFAQIIKELNPKIS